MFSYEDRIRAVKLYIPFVHDSVAQVMAVLVPAVMLTIWWIVRRIRHAHSDTAAEEKSSRRAAVLARDSCAVRLNRGEQHAKQFFR